MAGAPSSQEARPIDLVIRFTASIPDLVLSVASPDHISALGLKQLIRKHLVGSLASSRLRLISAGKVLPDKDSISRSISIPTPPPQGLSTNSRKDATGKGKDAQRASPPPQQHVRVYIHCSIGDALTPAELEQELHAANDADITLSSESLSSGPASRKPDIKSKDSIAPSSSTRGFDRLLEAGFTVDEVATLRTQFMAIQAHAHTPDTMPVGDELRALEDRWLDSDAGSTAAGGAGGASTGGFTAENGDLEDMLWGILMGFFWPIAAVCWLMREEGVWSPRHQTAVWVGALINIVFGGLRLSS